MTSNTPTCTHIGGQAVIEGVMMRGKLNWAVSARDEHGDVHTEELDLPNARAGWKTWPIVRGVVALVDSLKLGTKALTISAQLAGLEDVPEDAPDDAEPESIISKGAMTGALIAGVGLAVLIFIVAPTLVTNLLIGTIMRGQFLWNLVYGVMSLIAFFLYVWAIGFMPDMKRIFAYHGAEHKVIHAVEHGDELAPETCAKYPRLHIRCGTSFLLMVAVISIAVFTLIPIRTALASWGVENAILVTLLTITSRIALLPLVAGLAYEVTVKWAGPRPNNPLVKVLLWPGVQMQRMTTSEPSLDMIEVAIASTERILAREAVDPDAAAQPEPITAEYDLLDDAI